MTDTDQKTIRVASELVSQWEALGVLELACLCSALIAESDLSGEPERIEKSVDLATKLTADIRRYRSIHA